MEGLAETIALLRRDRVYLDFFGRTMAATRREGHGVTEDGGAERSQRSVERRSVSRSSSRGSHRSPAQVDRKEEGGVSGDANVEERDDPVFFSQAKNSKSLEGTRRSDHHRSRSDSRGDFDDSYSYRSGASRESRHGGRDTNSDFGGRRPPLYYQHCDRAGPFRDYHRRHYNRRGGEQERRSRFEDFGWNTRFSTSYGNRSRNPSFRVGGNNYFGEPQRPPPPRFLGGSLPNVRVFQKATEKGRSTEKTSTSQFNPFQDNVGRNLPRDTGGERGEGDTDSEDWKSAYAFHPPNFKTASDLLDIICTCPVIFCPYKAMYPRVPRGMLRAHLKKEHQLDFCHVCFRTMSTKRGDLQTHFWEDHRLRTPNGREEGKAQCPLCTNTFSFDGMYIHLATVHLIPEEGKLLQTGGRPETMVETVLEEQEKIERCQAEVGGVGNKDPQRTQCVSSANQNNITV